MSTYINPRYQTLVGHTGSLFGFALARTPQQIAHELPIAERAISALSGETSAFGPVPDTPEEALAFKGKVMNKISSVLSEPFIEWAFTDDPSIDPDIGIPLNYARNLGLVSGISGEGSVGSRIATIMQYMVTAQHVEEREEISPYLAYSFERALRSFGLNPHVILADKSLAELARLPRHHPELRLAIDQAVEYNALRFPYLEKKRLHNRNGITHSLLLEASAMELVSLQTFNAVTNHFRFSRHIAAARNRALYADFARSFLYYGTILIAACAVGVELVNLLFGPTFIQNWKQGAAMGAVVNVLAGAGAFLILQRQGSFQEFATRHEDLSHIAWTGKTMFLHPAEVMKSLAFMSWWPHAQHEALNDA